MEIERGDLGVSIGTSLALESIVGGINSEGTTLKPPGITRVVVNVRTIYRNLMGAITTSMYNTDDLVEAVKAEMMSVAYSVSTRSDKACEVIFYFIELPTYKALTPFALFKDFANGTELQKKKFQEEEAVFEMLFKDPIWAGVSVLSNGFPDGMPRYAIITHIPMDLLYTTNLQQVVLVESHTGTQKAPAQFATKIVRGAIANVLPFNKLTITLWGDNGGMLKSYPKGAKLQIFNLATSRGWHSLTTRAKIQEDLRTLNDKAFGEWCRTVI